MYAKMRKNWDTLTFTEKELQIRLLISKLLSSFEYHFSYEMSDQENDDGDNHTGNNDN